MSALEETFEAIVRKVIREELSVITCDRPEDLWTAEDVARVLQVKASKVYALVREKQLVPIMISKREMRFAPSVIREFQLKRGIKAA